MKYPIKQTNTGLINLSYNLVPKPALLKSKFHLCIETRFCAFFIFLILFGVQLSFSSCNSSSSNTETTDSFYTDDNIADVDCNAVSNEIALKSNVYKLKDTLWQRFRTRFPYHIQLVGNSEIQSDGSCLLMLSEPSPNVNEDDLNKVLKCYSHVLTFKQHQIGYDGWVKDVLITVSGAGITGIEDLEIKLNRLMFGTDYGAYSLKMQMQYETKYSPGLHKDLNYKIAPNELEEWFCSSNAIQFGHGTLPTILENYSNYASSLFYSKERGFVAWIIPQNHDISNERVIVRKFAIDADLILGAVVKNNTIAIIGRERQESVFDLPPLRTETLLQLAAANHEELAQSYERNNIMACKLPDGKDWAPIYLSPELINTEYGSLLNITDQLLKSWSQNGETRYENFSYQKPKKWIFEKALSRLMDDKFNSGSVTFNWNTSGATYQFNEGDYTVIGLNRTGSLPVSYIPDEESNTENDTYKNVEPFEQDGYNFFSDDQDANLIRAAQYAAVYQIFKANNIYSTVDYTNSFNTFYPLEQKTRELINKIKHLDENQIEQIVTQLYKNFEKKIAKQGIYLPEYEMIDIIDKDIENLTNLKDAVLELDKHLLEEPIVIKMLVNRNDNSLDVQQLSNESSYLYKSITSALSRFSISKSDYNLFGIDADHLLKEFVDYNQNSQPQWIKTPSAVVSFNKDAVVTYGGHNIDAALLKVEVSDGVKAGMAEIDNGIVKINAADQGRLTPEMLRKLGVEVKSGELKGIGKIESLSFNGAPPKPPRNIKSVFAEPPIPPDQRGFVTGMHDVLEFIKNKEKNIYRVNNKVITTCEDLQDLLFQQSKKNNGVIEFVDFSDENIEVRLKAVEFKMEMETGRKGVFAEIHPDETLLLKNKLGIGLVNRRRYKFIAEPESFTAKDGKDMIGVKLISTTNDNSVFIGAKSNQLSFSDKIKTAFKKAFLFSKNNDVDFVKKTYDELLAAGLTKNDFSLIMSNAKDCVICNSEDFFSKQFYIAYVNVPVKHNLSFLH